MFWVTCSFWMKFYLLNLVGMEMLRSDNCPYKMV